VEALSGEGLQAAFILHSWQIPRCTVAAFIRTVRAFAPLRRAAAAPESTPLSTAVRAE